jgi:hypothetical protein
MAQSQKSDSISVKKLASTLEPLIRRVVREELTRFLKKEANIFHLNPQMPLYEDMEEISRRKAKDQIELHSHEEVWGD